MNKYKQTLETMRTLHEVMTLAEAPGAEFEVKIHKGLLEDAMTSIDELMHVANEFAASFTVTQGKDKPRIAMDIERFFAAKASFELMMVEPDDV